MSKCECVYANPITCLAKRHQADFHMSWVMGGCSCRCHKSRNGGLIPSGEWEQNKKRVARPVRPSEVEA